MGQTSNKNNSKVESHNASNACANIHTVYKVGVMGAAGFAGAELVRLLIAHPNFELTVITSNADAGQPLASVYPAFEGMSDLIFSSHDNPMLAKCDAVFMAVPHTAAMASAPKLLEQGVSVFDLSADYRLSDPAVYEQWYNAKHTSPELLPVRAFGQPELFTQDLAQAATRHESGPVLVACAGCYPTATSLAAAPAVRMGLVADQGPVVVDAVSGVTGAGKSANARTHFCNADENLEAYSMSGHRHTPEIEQILGMYNRVVFTPHLAPLKRGLLSTVTLPLSEMAADYSDEQIVEQYREFYQGRSFVRVLDAGESPKTASVVGSNACQIGLVTRREAGVLVAVGAIDNLCKGAAGQAIQCANIVFGLPETTGLPLTGLPV